MNSNLGKIDHSLLRLRSIFGSPTEREECDLSVTSKLFFFFFQDEFGPEIEEAGFLINSQNNTVSSIHHAVPAD